MSILLLASSSCAPGTREIGCPASYTPTYEACARQWCAQHAEDEACVHTLDASAQDASRLDATAQPDGSSDGAIEGGSASSCHADADCTGRADGRVHCASTGACVGCRQDNDCPTTSPSCSAGSCTSCTASAACTRFATTPVCGASGACVACRADAAVLCTNRGEVCASGGETCVACNVSSDCASADTPVCEGHSCRGCQKDAECASAGKVCQESTGRCVACEPNAQDATQENCSNGRACDPTLLTCTGQPRGSLDRCGSTGVPNAPAVRCVSDHECREGLRCVMTKFQGQAYGAYCLAPAGNALCPNQYRIASTVMSALGVMDTYCFPNDLYATCESLLTFGNSCTSDADCGVANQDDGVCTSTGDGKRCTYRCSSASDCDRNACAGGLCPLQ